MSVEPFQTVARGDVVAMLDDSVLQGQIAAVEAEIERLRAEHGQDRAILEFDADAQRARWEADARAFERDTAQLAIALHEARVDLEYDRALLQGLESNVAHLDRLVERGHAAGSEVGLARAEAVATARRVEEGARLVADLEARQQDAEARELEFRSRPPGPPSRDPADVHLQNAIAVQEGLLRELLAQRELCVVRAPIDGTVLEIQPRAADAPLQRPGEGNMRRPGESVGPGEPIVVIASARPVEVVAWAPEGRDGSLEAGAAVVLTTMGGRRQIVEAEVSAVGASVERVPERLWGQLQIPEWGRPFLVPLPPDLAVAAGDRIHVRLR
jgi:hypothetical protein